MDLDGPYWTPESPLPPENATFGPYTTSMLISSTNCSYIYLGTNVNDNSKKALKFVKRVEASMERINNEITTMNLAQHNSILQIEDTFLYEHYICIVTPFAPIGSLHRLVQTQFASGLPENTARLMMKQMLEAINYLHGINIWHRDIKLDNFLVYDADLDNPVVILSDFGFARIFQENEKSEEYIGTPEFAAPEMFKNEPYDNSVDIWSLGITLYVMLSGRYPTSSFKIAPNDCRYKIVNGLLNYNLLNRLEISPDAIDLIHHMCQVDPNDRITAADALKHPWIASTSKQTEAETDIADALFRGEDYDNNNGFGM